jgi:hypothetical protein
VAWTDEDDKQILRMKAAGSTWAEIRDAVDKGSKSQVTGRYKELQGDSGKTAEQKKEEDNKKQAEKKAIGEKKKADCLAKNESEGKGGKNKKGKGKADEQKVLVSWSNHVNERLTESTQNDKADGKKSQGSGDMKAWADGFDRKKWIAVASKHYDKTGQRISPEMAREMAEEKG